MDFGRLESLKFDFNNTSPTLDSIPSTLLEALIPGYGIISQIIFRIFGFDIGLVVSGCLVVFGLSKIAQLLYQRTYETFASYFTSSIQIEDEDRLFSNVMEWVASQRMTKVSRDLKAVTKWVSAYEDDNDEEGVNDTAVLDANGIFNYEKWASNIPPRYEPNYGTDRFIHNKRTFKFSRNKRDQQRNFWGNGENAYLVISCVGRSTQPIKDLLNHIKKWKLGKESRRTSVYRPTPKQEHGDCAWDPQSCRPSRPIDTVSLDKTQKKEIQDDINEYLQPATARWYAARGIPHRRGYLFYGPPGTGKTSLSFALAGIFGLDIYCISLMEVGMTESDLNKLFSSLPRRCIVLLEDIDSAGLTQKRTEEPAKHTPDSSTDTSDSDSDNESAAKISKTDAAPKPARAALSSPGKSSLITLSGLLNTIDGAAAHEGRILIMTTNFRGKLDPALIRPGRVDFEVEFTNATAEQARDIFLRMYSTTKSEGRGRAAKEKVSAVAYELESKTPESRTLREQADRFAGEIPELLFSPAEIQGFLLMKKKQPQKAVDEVAAWVHKVLEEKRVKSK